LLQLLWLVLLPLVLHHLLQLLLPAVPALSSVSPLPTVRSLLRLLLHDLVLRRVLLRSGVLWSLLRFVLRLWPVLPERASTLPVRRRPLWLRTSPR
jgi:hypothetical protein